MADALTHSLYHGLLEVKCVPFLAPEPISMYSLDLIPVSHVMRSPVVTLREKMRVGRPGPDPHEPCDEVVTLERLGQG